MTGIFCFLFRIFSQTFRALIFGHKFSDPEFCKNKIVSPCPFSMWAFGSKSWKLRHLLLQATWRGALSVPYTILHPISLDFPDLPLIINNNYEKVSVYTGKNDIVTSMAAFIVNGIGHIHDVLLLCWVLINRGQFNKVVTSITFVLPGLNTIATLVAYTRKSFINLTPGTCFSLCTIQH